MEGCLRPGPVAEVAKSREHFDGTAMTSPKRWQHLTSPAAILASVGELPMINDQNDLLLLLLIYNYNMREFTDYSKK